jgi:spermidine synthase
MSASSVREAIRERAAFGVMLAAALLSGAAALSNEVVWSRLLIVPIGCSADATMIVLAAFMLGMAVGARAFGGLADRVAEPLRLYVFAEEALAAVALAMPLATRALASSGWPFPALLAAAGGLVFVPAIFMGASLPALARAFAPRGDALRLGIGPLYGAGTIGGALGAALAGYWTIPRIGLSASSYLAAGLSLAAAVIAAATSRALRTSPVRIKASTPEADETVPRNIALAALVAAAAGGAAMLAAEAIAARLLTFVFGHDTYAFAALLVVVLAGLGLGGLAHRRLARRDPALVVSILLAAFSLALVVSFAAAAALYVRAGRDPFGLGASGGLATSLRLELLRELLYTPILVLLPSIAAGALLPAACAMYAGPGARPGSRLGTALLANGVASAAGAVAVTAIAIPALGIQPTLFAVAAGCALASIFVAALSVPRSRRRPLLAVALIACAALAAVAALPRDLPRRMLSASIGARQWELVHYEEGRTGTVAVARNRLNGERQLFMNAVNEVTTRLVHDQSFKLLGHLAPLLHPDPKRGLMICFGAGISAGAALSHPFETLDIVELSSAIPRAADHFRDLNHGALADPRVRLHIDDGRHFLAASRERYDAVMVDSTHPKAVDSWALYTVEFYREIRAHLSPQGIAVQWVPLHGLSEREFKVIVRTFLEAFPMTTLWVNAGFETYGQAAYVKLVGTNAPLAIDYGALERRLAEPKISADLAPFGMDGPIEILDCFLAGPATASEWTNGLEVQTDDRPFLSYITDGSGGRRMEAALLNGVRSSVVPLLRNTGDGKARIGAELERAREAQGFVLAGLLDQARATWPEGRKLALFAAAAGKGPGYYASLADLYRDDAEKLFEIGNDLGNLGLAAEALDLYDRAIRASGDGARYRLNRALALLDLGRIDEAVEALSAGAAAEPDNPLASYDLGVALLAAGRPAAAIVPLDHAAALDPGLYGARMSLAEALRQNGDLDRAEEVLKAALAENPWLAEARDMLGLVAQARGETELAIEQHAEALRLDPYRAEAHYNIGLALRAAGRFDAAAEAFETAIRIDPADAEAMNELGRMYGAARRYDRAIGYCLRALEAAPEFPEAAFNLGLAYLGKGDRASAADAFSLALELAPDLSPAKQKLGELAKLPAAQPADAGAPDAGP